jgi:predicted nucleotidyltransferase
MVISDIKKKISPILSTYGVKKASLFGSVARGDDTQKSDVDILIKLGKPMGLLSYIGLNNKLEKVLHRKVDMVTESSLNKFIKPYILSDLKIIYEDR